MLKNALYLVDSLEKKEFCWDLVLFFVGCSFIEDLTYHLRHFLWTPVQQFISSEIQLKLYGNLHDSSLRWHLNRKTGEIVQIMNRGRNSINDFLRYVLFTLVPEVFDIVSSLVLLSIMFDWYFGVIIIATMWLYLCKNLRYL